MNFFNLSSRKEKKNKSHLKNLITVAMADGKMEFSEARLLITLAMKLGMNSKDISAIKNDLKSVKFTPPKNYNERVKQAHELVSIMMADHEISPDEVKLCKSLAVELNLLPKVIDDIIDYLTGGKNPQISMALGS